VATDGPADQKPHQEKPVKRTISIAAVTLLAVAAGCNSNNTKPNASLTPTPAVAQVQPEPTPAETATPAAAEQPMVIDTGTPAPTDVAASYSPSSSVSVASGGTYKIKAGDTLYRIALTHYGSGKDWKKIAAANPGINPNKLKVGQKLILP
jgi:5'-nucleotidase / UDP-sugar diphosphatase